MCLCVYTYISGGLFSGKPLEDEVAKAGLQAAGILFRRSFPILFRYFSILFDTFRYFSRVFWRIGRRKAQQTVHNAPPSIDYIYIYLSLYIYIYIYIYICVCVRIYLSLYIYIYIYIDVYIYIYIHTYTYAARPRPGRAAAAASPLRGRLD